MENSGNPGSHLRRFIEDSSRSILQNPEGNENYSNSYMNPAVIVPLFGEDEGRLLAAWRYCIYQAKQSWYCGEQQRLVKLAAGLELITGGRFDGLRELLRDDYVDSFPSDVRRMIDEDFDMGREDSCLRRGIAVTSNELGSGEFLESLPAEDIKRIAKAVVSGYIRGFHDDNKPLESKETVALSIPAGYGRVAELLRKEFLKNGLRMKVWHVTTTGTDLQMEYDHRFDWALFLDSATADRALQALESMFLSMQREAAIHSGRVYVMTFGDNRKSPEPGHCSVIPGRESSEIFQNLILKKRETVNRYLNKEETSYTGVAFPVPDIGENFQEIFMDTLAVNTLDSSVYCRIQDAIIDALDPAERVHVTGAEGNDTDISVSMHILRNPDRETTFMNCLSTVNIPLGEVFTSPVLKGTSGTLHVEEAFIAGILYSNLRLVFVDGYISDYSCSNFESYEKNRRFLYETLIHPHDTLPMGEFAIGTNTLAYSMAVKHGIMNKLPVLIAEKMGPHFAIGDTCFSGGEDHRCCNNSTGKEMVARFNEKTALRKEDPSKAYTSTHNDITIPYSSLGSVTALGSNGTSTEIIRDGRYVLPGTEYLNTYLDREEN